LAFTFELSLVFPFKIRIVNGWKFRHSILEKPGIGTDPGFPKDNNDE